MAHNTVDQKNFSVRESDLTSKESEVVPGGLSDNENRFDQALDFLKQHKNDAAVDLSRQASFTRALRRRVDFRVIPFLCCCYTLNFLDKVLLNVRHFENGRGQYIIRASANMTSMLISWEWPPRSTSGAMSTLMLMPTSG